MLRHDCPLGGTCQVIGPTSMLLFAPCPESFPVQINRPSLPICPNTATIWSPV
uniref:Uncharacterized protein n=1 Tax=Arundo donax TaxID=35708 RepID=A0A0A8ZGY3_ARUDO